MTQGTVKWFNDSKGFGFITAEDNTDVFVHHTSIRAVALKALPKVIMSALILNMARKVPKQSM